jgi:hypothetical protein
MAFAILVEHGRDASGPAQSAAAMATGMAKTGRTRLSPPGMRETG